MKKIVSITVFFVMLFNIICVNALTEKAYVSVFFQEYTKWSISHETNYGWLLFQNGTNANNTMRFNTAGVWTDSVGYSQPEYRVENVLLNDMPTEVKSGSGLTETIVKITQSANISMARMKSALITPLVTGDKIRVTFKIFMKDIYSQVGTKDINNTITSLPIRIVPQKGTTGVGNGATVNVPVNEWYTVSKEITITGDGVDGVRIDSGSSASVVDSGGYTKPFAATIYINGNLQIEKETEVEVPAERAKLSSWKTVSNINFESGGFTPNITSSNGSVAYINTLVAKYPQCEVGTRGENVYKFSMSENSSSSFEIDGFGDTSSFKAGNIVKVSMYVFPTDAIGNTPCLEMLLPKESGDPISSDHTTGLLNLPLNKWTKIGITFTYDGTEKLLRIKAPTDSYFDTLLIDDIKTEVYSETGRLPENLDYVEDFDTYNSNTSTYIKPNKCRAAGSGTWNLALYKNTVATINPYSNNSTLVMSNRSCNDMGVKINNIFQGNPDATDIGKTYKISVMVYADKNSGVYSENNTQKQFSAGTLEESTGTVFRFTLAGPDDTKYKYKYGGYGAKNIVVPWNTWTKLETEYVVSDAYLDNGSTASNANPLINAVRIDQYYADGSVNEGIVNTFYVDDFKVKEEGVEPVTIASCFGSNMVLQRNNPIEVWGYSNEADRKVTVKLGAFTKTTVTNGGKWSVIFDPMSAQTGLNLEFSYDGDDAKSVLYSNVAIGDVILAAGQSNMALAYKKISNDVSDIESDTKTLENVRILSMSRSGDLQEQLNNSTFSWISANSPLRSDVSAIGLMTGYNIAKEQNIPVGVIDASLGGVAIETFLSMDVLNSRTMYNDYIDSYQQIKAQGQPDSWSGVPTALYNSMICPLRGLVVSACIWYQGENNRRTDTGAMYEYKQQDLINMFRECFKNEDMPVAVCQLAPYSDGQYDNQIINLRQNQLNASRRQSGVYLIPTCDIGPVNADKTTTELIHPSNKRPVADRCYLAIEHHNYGYAGEYSGPQYEYMTVNGNTAVLHFSHADGLKIKPNDGENYVTGFTISGDGTNFVKADAFIENDMIKVRSDEVLNPVMVKYCHTNWTFYDANGVLKSGYGYYNDDRCVLTGHLGGNVFNSSDLPLAPFAASVADLTIESASAEKDGDNYKYEISISNIGISAINGSIFTALYSGNKLIDVALTNLEFATVDEKTYSVKTKYIEPDANTRVNVMVWDMNTMKPLCICKPILNLQQ